MKTKEHQYSYGEVLVKDARRNSYVQMKFASIKTKCPICQEHHNIMGLTDAFDLRIKEDILTLTDKTVHSDMRFHKDVFKIKYCPFCGREL